MRFILIAALVAAYPITLNAASLVTYNSSYSEANQEVRARFYQAAGVAESEHRLDFESGFADEQNIAGMLLPGRLMIRGNNGNDQVIIQEGPGSISLSNPVGNFAVSHTPEAFSGLVLDFSGSPGTIILAFRRSSFA